MATASTLDTDFAATGKKIGDRLQCVVVTPERTLFDELVDSVILPLFDGELGVLPGRSPMIGRLGYGELRTSGVGGTKRYFIDGGFAQVRDNVVTILTNRAIPTPLIDREAATRELEQAQTRRSLNEQEAADKTKAVDRARAMIRASGNAGVKG